VQRRLFVSFQLQEKKKEQLGVKNMIFSLKFSIFIAGARVSRVLTNHSWNARYARTSGD
jgi:hypothetical protein